MDSCTNGCVDGWINGPLSSLECNNINDDNNSNNNNGSEHTPALRTRGRMDEWTVGLQDEW